MGLFFTADHHFAHANIIRYCQRPFATVAEMDAALVQQWNVTVGASDIVYHFGDFTLQGLPQFAVIVRQLNGRLRIIPGSHIPGRIPGARCSSADGREPRNAPNVHSNTEGDYPDCGPRDGLGFGTAPGDDLGRGPVASSVLSSPLSSRARRSWPLRRRSTSSARRRPATGRLRRGSPRR
jgi:hypothetical protein